MTVLAGEYRERAERLRGLMDAEGLEALILFAWKRGQVRYVSGYQPNYIANVALVVLPRHGPPALRIRFPFDLARAQRESWIEDVAASGEVLNLATDAAAVLRKRGAAGGRIGIVAGDSTIDELPHSLYCALQEALPGATLIGCDDLMRRLRVLKSPAELDLLRASARVADVAVNAALGLVAAGRSEFEIVARGESAARGLGAGGYLVTIASQGATEPIGPPKHQCLAPGDDVIVEVAVEVDGYWTQVARVAYVGEPAQEQRAIYAATYAAYVAAVAAACPGSTCGDVARAATMVLEDAGLAEYIEHDFGHGIGLDLPEPPRIEHHSPVVIEPGTVLVIHPSVRVPGRGGAFLGGTVLVESEGPRPIHVIPPCP